MLLPYYPPDVAADGQLFSLLAPELARRGWKVKVLTWKPRYQGTTTRAPARETRDGVRVSRWWAPRSGKSLLSRAFGAWWITATAFWRALFSRGVLLMPSSPPTLGLVGWWLSWVGRRYIYVLHDIHPELGIALGRMNPGPLASLLRFVQRRELARGRTITLTEGKAEKANQLQRRAQVSVVPNWVDTQAITPKPKVESEFAREHGLTSRESMIGNRESRNDSGVDSRSPIADSRLPAPEREPFVIQYSGNLGLLHPLEGLTAAMYELSEARLTYIGRGAKLEATREQAAELTNVEFFDYQPFDRLSDSLASCNLAVVAIEPGADRLAIPSKLQGILASGRPVLALAPEESELAQLVEKHRCGWVVADFDDPGAVARTIRAVMANPAEAAKRAQAAREAAETFYSTAQAADGYLAALDQLLTDPVEPVRRRT
jgi:glycosyltransferase involved in cell wall biosynthesis